MKKIIKHKAKIISAVAVLLGAASSLGFAERVENGYCIQDYCIVKNK